jgi:uncharacterized protein YjbI with pentapeptide repeats
MGEMPKIETAAPKIRAFRLPRLEDGDPATLAAGDEREAERFVDTDLSGRELLGITFAECELDGVTLSEADLRGARVIESTLARMNAPILSAARSTWRDVVLDQSRIGSGELFDSTWRSVRFSHCRLGYLNLRGAELLDIEFVDCAIDEIDLGGAKANRVAFVNTSVDALDITRATLRNFDLRGAGLHVVRGIEGLRGATISEKQLLELSAALAELSGIVVAPS